MDYAFVKFKGGKGKQESVITIQKPNSLGFSSQFYQDNIVNEFKYAILYYDSGNRAIGIKLTNNEEEENKYCIAHAKKGHAGSIVSKSFFKTNNIDPYKYVTRYHWEKERFDGIGDLFIIKLQEKKQ
jgi:hypothetical protein